MPNNPINKVVFGEDTLIDLTGDTVTADKLAQGYTAHNAAGVQITGTMTPGGGGDEDSMQVQYYSESGQWLSDIGLGAMLTAFSGGATLQAVITDENGSVKMTSMAKPVFSGSSVPDAVVWYFIEEDGGTLKQTAVTHAMDGTVTVEETTLAPGGAAVFTYNLDITDDNNITVISAPTFAEIMATAQTRQPVMINIFAFIPGLSPTNPVFALSTTNIMLLMVASPFSIDISAIGNVSSSSAGWVTISHNANDEITAKVITHNIPQA